MKYFLTILAILATPVVADVFDHLEAVHNTGQTLTEVIVEDKAKVWEAYFTEGRGVGLVLDGRIQGNYGLARWSWRRGNETQNGWIAIKTKDTKIVNWWYTEKPPTYRPTALLGQGADVTSTAIGLSSGFVEANPLLNGVGFPAAAALKIGGTIIAERSEMSRCYAMSTPLQSVGLGAAVWNTGLLLGAGPWGILPAIGLGYASHKTHDPFWRCLPDGLQTAGTK